MSLEQMEGIIEAVLFTMGDSVEAGKLADAIEQDVDTTVKIVHNLMDKDESENRGIRIIELENSFQLCTKQEYYDALIRVCSQPRRYTLTDAALETLSIIAYKQPVTKIDVVIFYQSPKHHSIHHYTQCHYCQSEIAVLLHSHKGYQ